MPFSDNRFFLLAAFLLAFHGCFLPKSFQQMVGLRSLGHSTLNRVVHNLTVETNTTATEIPNSSLTKDLPTWLQDYAQWHRHSKAQLNETNWNSSLFLVLTARPNVRAGGLTDRLRPLPYFLKLAASTGRILLIHWTRPFPLEEFLLPPDGGLDWRTPPFMQEAIHSPRKVIRRQSKLTPAAHNTNRSLLTVQMQANDYGEGWYNMKNMSVDEPPLERVFRPLWNWAFTPSPPVAHRLAAELQTMGLQPGHYSSAHIRAVYAVESRSAVQISSMAHRALDCLSQIATPPFFVAADTPSAVQAAMDYGQSHNVTIVTAQKNRTVTQHIDIYNETDASLSPQDFYDAFVDLYLLGNTRCTAFGVGGFGQWGTLLGFNSTCKIRHHGRDSEVCTWRSPSSVMVTG